MMMTDVLGFDELSAGASEDDSLRGAACGWTDAGEAVDTTVVVFVTVDASGILAETVTVTVDTALTVTVLAGCPPSVNVVPEKGATSVTVAVAVVVWVTV
ncbi:hypothetical protein H4R21_002107 [Coemansia helicoidea]|uniref:Uncharacterized protein n=1 Tax=Coemansia helicoidea TaxID=1286919 RepID=A0ACC1L8N1_9FUNG|nr:hypothetical protein H4R21_002107 [Coemansia helicoidea]